MSNFSQNIPTALAKIKGTGSFWSNGVTDFVFPGLKVNGLDELAFPIAKNQVEELIDIAARKAPFGKGSETVLDTSVRDTWEIDASQISFNNLQWNNLINKIVEEIKPDLGIENYEISAHLYKMLIYGEGGFFRRHRDSEKEPGMFATLVVGLPSKHEGGEFIVQFEDKRQQISFSEATEKYKIPYIAFYADCEHEVRPVTQGYRVCLTYNLVQQKSSKQPKAIPLSASVDKLTQILKNAGKETDTVKAILLGHHYTPANFGLNTLKLNDRPKAEALIKAAGNAGFYAKLGLVTSYQSGELLTEGSDYGYRRGGWYDDEDDDQELAQDGEMGEIYEEYITIDHWANNTLPPLEGLKMEDEDIIKDFVLNDGEPDEKEAEGYTGNAGMEMMYWYHYGAVFMWKKTTHYDVVQALPLATKLKWLRYYVAHWSDIEDSEKRTAKKIAIYSLAKDSSVKDSDINALADYFLLQKTEKRLTQSEIGTLVYHFEHIDVEKWMELLLHFDADVSETLFSLVSKEKSKKKPLICCSYWNLFPRRITTLYTLLFYSK